MRGQQPREQTFEDLLEGRASQASPQLDQLVKLAQALGPQRLPSPDPHFRARLRGALVAEASASEEDLFASLLEGPVPDAPPELAPLAGIARALQPSVRPAAGAHFRVRLRNALLTQATRRRGIGVRLADAIGEWNRRVRRSARVATAAALAAVVMLGGSVALAASSAALPGDALYGLKRFRESVTLGTVSGPAKGFRMLGFARTRLEEVRGLLDRGERDEVPYIIALDGMDELTEKGATILIEAFNRGGPRDLLLEVVGFAREQAVDLRELVDGLPPAAQPFARDSIAFAETVEIRARSLLGGCACREGSLFAPSVGPAPAGVAQSPRCACEEQAAGGGPGDGDGAKDETGDGSGGNGGNGGNGGEDDPTVDLPDVPGTDLDEQAEDQVNELIDGILEDLPAIPTPTATPSVPLP